VARVAEEVGLAHAQGGDFAQDGLVVEVIVVVAAMDVGLIDLAAQIAVLRILQKRENARIVEGESPFAGLAAFGGGLGGGGDDGRREARQVRGVSDKEGVFVGLLEHIIAEFQSQHGQLLIDRPQLFFAGVVEVGPAADEIAIVLREHHLLFGGQAERGALFINRLDARKEVGVEADVVAVAGEQGRRLLGDLLQGIAGQGGGHVEEDAADPGEQLPAQLEGVDGVGKGGRLGIGGDGRYLELVLADALLNGREVMLVPDLAEGRHAEGGFELLEQGIILGQGSAKACGQAEQGDHEFSHGTPRFGVTDYCLKSNKNLANVQGLIACHCAPIILHFINCHRRRFHAPGSCPRPADRLSFLSLAMLRVVEPGAFQIKMGKNPADYLSAALTVRAE